MPRKQPPAAARPSSSARLKAAGRKPVLLWLDPAEAKKIAAAAKAERRPVTQTIIFHALRSIDLPAEKS